MEKSEKPVHFRSLNIHSTMHTRGPRYVRKKPCLKCGMLFAHDSGNFRRHAQKCTGTIEKCRCLLCPNHYSSFAWLSGHMIMYHTVKSSLTCNTCDVSFSDLNILREHMMVHTFTAVTEGQQDSEPHENHPNGSAGIGKISKYGFLSRDYLHNHTKSPLRKKQYNRQKCGQRLRLSIHKKIEQVQHSKQTDTDISEGIADADAVGSSCDTTSSAIAEDNLATQNTEHETNPAKGLAEWEMQTTTNNTNNPEKSFATESVEKIRKSRCNICKRFYSCYYMNDHMNIHLGKKPHKCQMCGERFMLSSKLSTHKRTCVKRKCNVVHGRQCGRHCCTLGLTTEPAASEFIADPTSESAASSCEITSGPQVDGSMFAIVKAVSVDSESDTDDMQPAVDQKTLPITRLVAYPLKLTEMSNTAFTDACRRANEFGISYVGRGQLPGALRIGCAFFSFRAVAVACDVLQSLKTIRDDLTVRFLQPQENIKKTIESLKSEIIDAAVMSSNQTCPTVDQETSPTSRLLADDMDVMSKAYGDVVQDDTLPGPHAHPVQQMNSSCGEPLNNDITKAWMNYANMSPPSIHPNFYQSAVNHSFLPATISPASFIQSQASFDTNSDVNFANQSAGAFGQTVGHVDPFSVGSLAATYPQWSSGSQSLFSSVSLPGLPGQMVNLPVPRSSANGLRKPRSVPAAGAVRLKRLISADQKLQMEPVVLIKERISHNLSAFEQSRPINSTPPPKTDNTKPHSWKNCHKTTLQRLQQLKQRRQWPCSVCHKLFSSSAYAKIHQRLHSEGRPHRCQLCDKSYFLRQHLNTHLNMVHPETV